MYVKRKAFSLFLSFCIMLSLPYSSCSISSSASVVVSEDDTCSLKLKTEQLDSNTDFVFSSDFDQLFLDTPVLTLDKVEAECNVLQYVDATAFEEAKHVARLPEEETFNTYVFLNHDGTKSVYYLDENVKYIGEDGGIREKDLTLMPVLNGYRIVDNEYELFLPYTLEDGIAMEYNGHTVRILPQGGNTSIIAEKRVSRLYILTTLVSI